MRLICFVLNENSLALALKIRRNSAENITIMVPAKLKTAMAAADIKFYADLHTAVAAAFASYDGIIFIMAVGIVVRTIADLVQDKLHDPAVVVFDECGKHGISLLSGHVGGANALTKRLCLTVDAEPVITTATDVHKKIAPDLIAGNLNLVPWPKAHIKFLNQAVLSGRTINWFIDASVKLAKYYEQKLLQQGQKVTIGKWNNDCLANGDYWALIASKNKLLTQKKLPANVLGLAYSKLIAGVGCRKGTPVEVIYAALKKACAKIGVPVAMLSMLASTVFKQNETGLIAAAALIDCPIKFYDNESLQKAIVKYNLTESAFVKQTIGVGNVSEAAAYAAAGGDKNRLRLALAKTKYNGRVTVALLWQAK